MKSSSLKFFFFFALTVFAVDSTAQVKALRDGVANITTGIESTRADVAPTNSLAFDLGGRPVSPSNKGLVVSGGKIILNK